jgi:ABC-type dipeptide/oligopeptide/nickel transport system permease subunit
MQEDVIEASLDDDKVITQARRPLSRNRLVWLRLKGMPRFWVGASVLVFIVLWAFLGPLLYQWSPTQRDSYNMNLGPTMMHWFGTNAIGQDIYAQTLSGLQKSLVIGLIAGPAATIIAAVVGSTAGYLGGWVDKTIGWFVHLLLVIPDLGATGRSLTSKRSYAGPNPRERPTLCHLG